MPYDSLASRAEAAGDLPAQIAEEIVGDVETTSTVLALIADETGTSCPRRTTPTTAIRARRSGANTSLASRSGGVP